MGIYEYGNMFSNKQPERMLKRKPYDHSIPKEQNSLDEWIDEELQKGYIQPSKSPVFFIQKCNGGLRPCIDYHELNQITAKNC